jgi:uncharacterized protein YdeI (BOF family)
MQKPIIAAAAVSAFFLFATPAFAQDGCPAPAAGHVKVFDGRSGEISAAQQPTQSGGMNGRNGSATDLRDAPRPQEDSTIKPATLFGRKAGDDKRQDAQPASTGLRKVGTGTLAVGSTDSVGGNNLKQIGLANTCR